MLIWLWIGFILFVLVLLALDLGVFNRKAHVIGVNEAMLWTAVWVVLALAFNVGVYWLYEHHVFGIGTGDHMKPGKIAAIEFFTGYVVEKSLSLDNIFVIAIIFSYFNVPAMYQHRVLFWGILGALVLRGVMIALGAALIARFAWINYVFGGILIITAVKMLLAGDEKVDPDRNILVRIARRIFPVTRDYQGEHFFTRLDGARAITPLFLVLLVVESTDVLFAVDSIPAIFAITADPFIVFTSNVFAILGLRSLYFALAGVLDKFRYLKISLVFVLAFVGVKMLIHHQFKFPPLVSLAIIGGILVTGVLGSIFSRRGGGEAAPEPPVGGPPATLSLEATWKQIRRVFIFLIGSTVVLIGLALIVLPGPATLVIPVGLAVLGSEFLWARKLLKLFKDQARALVRGVIGNRGSDVKP